MKFTLHQPSCYFCQQPLIMDDETNQIHSTFYKGHQGVCHNHTYPVWHHFFKYNLSNVDFVLNTTQELKGKIIKDKLILYTYRPIKTPTIYTQYLTSPISYEECNRLLIKIVKMIHFI